MSRLFAWAVAASLAVPILLIGGMALQAERAVHTGTVIRVPITGYDPRDPLRGHYLRYRFAWNWEGPQPPPGVAALCVGDGIDNPPVHALPPDDRSCRLSMRLDPMRHAFPEGLSDELFVPEARAAALQSALRHGDSTITIDLAIGPDGLARIKAWHVDGQSIEDWLP